jgi:hypothetical protein
VFSVLSVLKCYKQGQLAVAVELVDELATELLRSSRCELLLLAEAGGSSGTQRKGNVRHWKPLPSKGSDTSL